MYRYIRLINPILWSFVSCSWTWSITPSYKLWSREPYTRLSMYRVRSNFTKIRWVIFKILFPSLFVLSVSTCALPLVLLLWLEGLVHFYIHYCTLYPRVSHFPTTRVTWPHRPFCFVTTCTHELLTQPLSSTSSLSPTSRSLTLIPPTSSLTIYKCFR